MAAVLLGYDTNPDGIKGIGPSTVYQKFNGVYDNSNESKNPIVVTGKISKWWAEKVNILSDNLG